MKYLKNYIFYNVCYYTYYRGQALIITMNNSIKTCIIKLFANNKIVLFLLIRNFKICNSPDGL